MEAEQPDYAGMTVNERLFVAGLMELFDDAVNRRDREQAIKLLGQVAISAEDAAESVATILSNPSKYGYPRST